MGSRKIVMHIRERLHGCAHHEPTVIFNIGKVEELSSMSQVAFK
jgi:hypothetical protein